MSGALMRGRRSLAIAAVAASLLLTVPGATAGPLSITPTSIEMYLDLLAEGSTLPPGAQTEGFVFTNFCHGMLGLNPLGGRFVYVYAVIEAPAWLDARITGGNTREDQPPFGPTLNEESCYLLDTVFLRITASLDAPRGHTGTVVVEVTVTPEGDVGTYQTPDGVTASGTIRISD